MNAIEETAQDTQAGNSTAPEQSVPVIPKAEIDAIIRKRVYGAMALGLAPVAVLDLVGLFGIEVELVNALAEKYGVPFSKNRAKSLIGSLLGSALPVAVAPAVFSLLKAIPLIGMTAGAATMTIMGGASTYAIGRVFNRHFASGGTMLDMETGKFKESFRTHYNEGKEYVKNLRKKKPADGETAEGEAAEPAQESAASAN